MAGPQFGSGRRRQSVIMPNNFTIDVRSQNLHGPDSFMELVRLKGNYLFDEVTILKVTHNVAGIEIQFDYERNGARMRDVPAAIIPKSDWAAARELASAGATPEEKRKRFA